MPVVSRNRTEPCAIEYMRRDLIVEELRSHGEPLFPVELAARLNTFRQTISNVVAMFDDIETLDDGSVWIKGDVSYMDGSKWWHHLNRRFAA